jgi:hypothetical protein
LGRSAFPSWVSLSNRSRCAGMILRPGIHQLDEAAQGRAVAIETVKAALRARLPPRRTRWCRWACESRSMTSEILAAAGEQRSEVQRRGGFSHAALLVEHRNLGHITPGGIRLVPEFRGFGKKNCHTSLTIRRSGLS